MSSVPGGNVPTLIQSLNCMALNSFPRSAMSLLLKRYCTRGYTSQTSLTKPAFELIARTFTSVPGVLYESPSMPSRTNSPSHGLFCPRGSGAKVESSTTACTVDTAPVTATAAFAALDAVRTAGEATKPSTMVATTKMRRLTPDTRPTRTPLIPA